MSQHFLLSSRAKTLTLASVARMSDERNRETMSACNVFNYFLIAYGGLDIVTKDGKLHLDDPKVKEAAIKAPTSLAAPGTISQTFGCAASSSVTAPRSSMSLRREARSPGGKGAFGHAV